MTFFVHWSYSNCSTWWIYFLWDQLGKRFSWWSYLRRHFHCVKLILFFYLNWHFLIQSKIIVVIVVVSCTITSFSMIISFPQFFLISFTTQSIKLLKLIRWKQFFNRSRFVFLAYSLRWFSGYRQLCMVEMSLPFFFQRLLGYFSFWLSFTICFICNRSLRQQVQVIKVEVLFKQFLIIVFVVVLVCHENWI